MPAKRIGLFVFGLSLAIVGRAGTVAVATGKVSDPLTTSFSILNSYDDDFTLLVTGGVGDGMFIPNLYADGETTDPFPETGYAADSAISSLTTSQGGSIYLYGPTAYGYGNNSCQVEDDGAYFQSVNCGWMTFTFGVPEDIHVSGQAYVSYTCVGQNCSASAGEILSASAGFAGFLGFFTTEPGVFEPVPIINPSYSLTEVEANETATPVDTMPEPASIWLICIAGAGLMPLGKKRVR